MTQSLDLNKMGLIPMNEFEMQEVVGGGFWTWICGVTGAVVGFFAGGIEGAIAGAAIGFLLGAWIDGDPDTTFTINGKPVQR